VPCIHAPQRTINAARPPSVFRSQGVGEPANKREKYESKNLDRLEGAASAETGVGSDTVVVTIVDNPRITRLEPQSFRKLVSVF
jgi:hypothetical protein